MNIYTKIKAFFRVFFRRTKAKIYCADVNLLPFGLEYNYELIKEMIKDWKQQNTNDLSE